VFRPFGKAVQLVSSEVHLNLASRCSPTKFCNDSSTSTLAADGQRAQSLPRPSPPKVTSPSPPTRTILVATSSPWAPLLAWRQSSASTSPDTAPMCLNVVVLQTPLCFLLSQPTQPSLSPSVVHCNAR